jgi:hypothetical protein
MHPPAISKGYRGVYHHGEMMTFRSQSRACLKAISSAVRGHAASGPSGEAMPGLTSGFSPLLRTLAWRPHAVEQSVTATPEVRWDSGLLEIKLAGANDQLVARVATVSP